MEKNSEAETCVIASQSNESNTLCDKSPKNSPKPSCNDVVVCIITPYSKVIIGILEKIGALEKNYRGDILYALKIASDNDNFMTLNFKIIHSVSYTNIENEISTYDYNYFLFLIAGESTNPFDSYGMSLLASYLNEKQICKVEFINLSLIDSNVEPDNHYQKFKKQNEEIRVIQMQNDLYRTSLPFKFALDKLYYTSKLTVLCAESGVVIMRDKLVKTYFESKIQTLLSDITNTVKFTPCE